MLNKISESESESTPFCNTRNLRSNDMMLVRPWHSGPRLRLMEKSVYNLRDLWSGIIYLCLFAKVLPVKFLNLFSKLIYLIVFNGCYWFSF